MNQTLDLRELNVLVAVEVMKLCLTAETSIEIGQAVTDAFRSNSPKNNGSSEMGYRWNGTEYTILNYGSKWNYGGAQGNDGYGLWCWENRMGQEWQNDIEAHVKAWRKPTRPYSSNLEAAWEVFNKMMDGLASQRMRFFEALQKQATYEVNGRMVTIAWPDVLMVLRNRMPEAICRAAIETVRTE